jgi:hypothetical protein
MNVQIPFLHCSNGNGPSLETKVVVCPYTAGVL